MQYAERYLDQAAVIIDRYDGTVPLHHFLKQFFSADKKFGSRDRKAISHACYCYYRLGHAVKALPVKDRLRLGIFLCTEDASGWQTALPHVMHPLMQERLAAKLEFANSLFSFSVADIFPWADELSAGIDALAFSRSHLVQPDLHLRIRPGKDAVVLSALRNAGILFTECGHDCLALQNSTRLENVLAIDRDVVVQDRSSQRIAEYFPADKPVSRVWDCCAASGGKSILAADRLGEIELTVSDLRASIIANLKHRLAAAGIKRYRSFVADLSDIQPSAKLPSRQDLVICDAPCSGSGTWSRSPEQLYFFDKPRIGYYANLQRKISENVVPAVGDGGYLLYVTCSVFRKENEEMVEQILRYNQMQLQRSGIISGYGEKADTMFAALFSRAE